MEGLTIKLYDGSTNPDEHLNVFKTHMTIYTTNKATTSLQEGPISWFTQLPPNFVESFKLLTTKVITHYATSRSHHTSSMSLFNVKQEKMESLRTFMDRFRKVCMSIRNLMSKIVMHHLISTILPSQFTKSLIKRLAKNINKLRNQASKFM